MDAQPKESQVCTIGHWIVRPFEADTSARQLRFVYLLYIAFYNTYVPKRIRQLELG
jgi:hypothetical protein